MSLFNELKRRNVFRVAAAYLVIGWLLLQVTDTVVPALHLPDWIISALTLVLLLGFIPTVLFSWAYELTPDGLKKDSEVSANQVSSFTAKKLDVITLIAVVAVMLLVAWQQFGTKPKVAATDLAVADVPAFEVVETNVADTANTDDQSIAVLPFADLSPQSDQAYFSDGIAEEILNVLVKVKALKVASRTSSFGFKGQESMGIPAIAAKLNVRHVLEGSVRKSGQMVRVTAQLIDAQTDQHLWSETYDRELTTENLFAIQDEVAKAIVEQLGIALKTDQQLTHEGHQVPALNNYDLFLKARALYRARLELDMVDGYLRQILEQEPDYAPAWELRAAVALLMPNYGFSDLTFVAAQEKVNLYAEKALALNPNSALSLAAKAYIRHLIAWEDGTKQDYQSIINDLIRAIEIDPNLPSPMNWLGLAYAAVGQTDLSTATFQTCKQRHPFFSPCTENLYDIKAGMGLYDESWEIFKQANEQGISTGNWVNFITLAQQQERTAFLLVAGSPNLLLGWHRLPEIYDAYQNLDQDHSSLVADIRAYSKSQSSFDPYFAKILLFPLGDVESKPYEFFLWGPHGKKYRQSASFKPLFKTNGIFDYWQLNGYPLQCRAEGDDDFECD
ncbi:tetratricopeptide repeat protein [Marinicella litoralis]|uniref:TolB-like protein n=1 Tax=Marinicella litoralis TaxID=644220 RepID=A0A4R6XVV6_9GAMM|nr:hypothetical protein [Marinicella litoralis]TDR22354.1 TolB-like protein [Marinicella litoralis]